MKSLPMDIVNEILILHGSHEHYNKFKNILEDIRLYATRFRVYRLVIEYNKIAAQISFIDFLKTTLSNSERLSIVNDLILYRDKHTSNDSFCLPLFGKPWCTHMIMYFNKTY